MVIWSGVPGSGTAHSLCESEYIVPLPARIRTLFRSNMDIGLHFQGAHFGARGLVTHLLVWDRNVYEARTQIVRGSYTRLVLGMLVYEARIRAS